MSPATCLALAGLLLATGCGAPADPAGLLSAHRIVDLGHDFGEDTIYWPTEAPFALEVLHAGPTPGGWYYAANRFSAPEHGGTHLDAPHHFAESGESVEAIPLERLLAPASVVPLRHVAAEDADARIQPAHLEAFEAEHGRIPQGTIVLLDTGWARFWPDRARYLGTAETGPTAVQQLHFPGLSAEAARWLAEERRVAAVGIDTASIDPGDSGDFAAHRILATAHVPVFENVTALDAMPATGSFVIALPMKIRGGSGGPLRIVALVPRR